MKLLLDYGTTRIRASIEKDSVLYPVEFPEGLFLGSVVNFFPQGDIEFSSFPIMKSGVKSFVGLKQRLLKSTFFRSNEIDAFLNKTELYFSRRIDTRSHFYVVDGELVAGDAPFNASPRDFDKDVKVSLETHKKPTVISFGPLGEREYDIAQYSLNELKNIVQSKTFSSQIDELVVGIPVSPSKPYLDLLKTLSKKVRFVYEPLAAVFGVSGQIEKGTHCVFDFGGGTLDIVVFSYSKGFEKLIGRLQLNFGGVNIDNGILEYLKRRQPKEYQRYFDNRLLPTIRSLKERLSYEEKVEDFFLDEETGQIITLNMERSEFEDNILIKTMQSVFESIEGFVSTINRENVDSILVCGGSCVIPFFQRKLNEIVGSSFRSTPIFNDDAFLVSRGLSVASAYSIVGDRICVVDPEEGKAAVIYDVSDIPEKKYFIIHNRRKREIRLDFCLQDISEPLESFSANLKEKETFASISYNENQGISLNLEGTSVSTLGKASCIVGDEYKAQLICRIEHKTLKTPISRTCTFSPKLVDIFGIPTSEEAMSEYSSGRIDPSILTTSESSQYGYSLELDSEPVFSEDLVTLQVLILVFANFNSELSRLNSVSERFFDKTKE